MDDDITIHSGIRGTRVLAAAFATVALRKRGALNKYLPWSEKIHRPWTPAELKLATDMRADGKSFVEIGHALQRTKQSVHSKIAPQRRAA